MISVLTLAAAAALQQPATAQKRFNDCVTLSRQNANKAIAEAEAWKTAGGGVLARQCLGLAYVSAERWADAATTFEQVASLAESQRDGRAATLWVQAGNAALAGDDAAKARAAFDHALALPTLSSPMRGEALLDRARAAVAGEDPMAARVDLDAALKLVPEDPMAWLLSATLARRQQDLDRAAKDIAEALRLAPDASPVAYEQGNIEYDKGQADLALGAWRRAIALDKSGTEAGQAARMAIAKYESEAAPKP